MRVMPYVSHVIDHRMTYITVKWAALAAQRDTRSKFRYLSCAIPFNECAYVQEEAHTTVRSQMYVLQ